MRIPLPFSHIRVLRAAQRHAGVILSQNVKDFAVLFAEIADAYFEKHLWAEAKPIYELLGGDSEVRRALLAPIDHISVPALDEQLVYLTSNSSMSAHDGRTQRGCRSL